MADVTDAVKDKVNIGQDGDGNGTSSLSSLLSKEWLIPAAATAAAGVAATQAPKLAKKLSAKSESAAQRLGQQGAEGAKEAITGGGGGGIGKLATSAVSKVLGGKGGGGGAKKTRRLPIQRWTDVAAPIDQVYEQWTKFDDYPKFMHRVLHVKQQDDDKVKWEEKIWFSKRQWTGKITDRRKNDRIAWKTEGGMSHAGVVSFHKLDDHLTRVMVTMDFVPSGMFEKMASGLRFVKRAVQADLARFKAYVEMNDAEGLEYKSAPEAREREKEREERKKEKEKEQKSREKSEQRSQNGKSASDENDDDDKDREAERRERESRRQERKEALSA